MSDSLQPHELQHARLLSPSLSPRVCSNSCPLSWWWHPTTSSSVTPSPGLNFSSIRVFSIELGLHIRWPKYWSFCFNISPSNEYSELISFRFDWFDLLVVQGILKSLSSTVASIHWCSAFFMVQLSQPYLQNRTMVKIYLGFYFLNLSGLFE